jgi:hypothetical protein
MADEPVNAAAQVVAEAVDGSMGTDRAGGMIFDAMQPYLASGVRVAPSPDAPGLAGWLGQLIDEAEADGHRVTMNVAAAKRLRAALASEPPKEPA